MGVVDKVESPPRVSRKNNAYAVSAALSLKISSCLCRRRIICDNKGARKQNVEHLIDSAVEQRILKFFKKSCVNSRVPIFQDIVVFLACLQRDVMDDEEIDIPEFACISKRFANALHMKLFNCKLARV